MKIMHSAWEMVKILNLTTVLLELNDNLLSLQALFICLNLSPGTTEGELLNCLKTM